MRSAAEVTSALGPPLTVIHVVRDGTGGDTKVLDEARRYLQPYGLEFRCETVVGLPHQRITETLREGGHDLLFIGAYGHSRIIEMVLGSTTEYVLRNSRQRRHPLDRAPEALVDEPLQLPEAVGDLRQLLDAPPRPLGRRAERFDAPVDGRGEVLQRRLAVSDDVAQDG